MCVIFIDGCFGGLRSRALYLILGHACPFLYLPNIYGLFGRFISICFVVHELFE